MVFALAVLMSQDVVSFRHEGAKVETVLAAFARQTGARVSVGEGFDRDFAAVCVTDVAPDAFLSRFAATFDAAWEQKDGALVLVRDEAEQSERESNYRRQLIEKYIATERAGAAAPWSEAEAQAIIRDLKYVVANPDMERPWERWGPANQRMPRHRAPFKLWEAIGPDRIAELRYGRTLKFATKPNPFEEPMPAEAAAYVREIISQTKQVKSQVSEEVVKKFGDIFFDIAAFDPDDFKILLNTNLGGTSMQLIRGDDSSTHTAISFGSVSRHQRWNNLKAYGSEPMEWSTDSQIIADQIAWRETNDRYVKLSDKFLALVTRDGFSPYRYGTTEYAKAMGKDGTDVIMRINPSIWWVTLSPPAPNKTPMVGWTTEYLRKHLGGFLEPSGNWLVVRSQTPESDRIGEVNHDRLGEIFTKLFKPDSVWSVPRAVAAADTSTVENLVVYVEWLSRGFSQTPEPEPLAGWRGLRLLGSLQSNDTDKLERRSIKVEQLSKHLIPLAYEAVGLFSIPSDSVKDKITISYRETDTSALEEYHRQNGQFFYDKTRALNEIRVDIQRQARNEIDARERGESSEQFYYRSGDLVGLELTVSTGHHAGGGSITFFDADNATPVRGPALNAPYGEWYRYWLDSFTARPQQTP